VGRLSTERVWKTVARWLPHIRLNARMHCSMTPDNANRPKIGIPWRTSQEEATANRPKIQNYEDSVRRAGGDPVLLSLNAQDGLAGLLASLDGFVLPGSPADVDPTEYGAVNNGKSETADAPRERTDRSILDHAFAEKKPVLAICYGCQLLNVHLGGTLIQDVSSETRTSVAHRKKDVTPEPLDDPRHEAKFEPGSRLATLAGSAAAVVNSSHHQSVERAGKQLKITGQASDGVVESVEWTGDANWVVGVQWHPERMAGDTLADRLFEDFIAAARQARKVAAGKA
jgi:putative glutamine amidotransferase